MKPILKTTAIAIFVALATNACKSNDPGTNTSPIPINNQSDQEAKAKAEQEAKAKAEQEAKAKAEQEAKVKAEQEPLRIQMELAKIPQSKGKEWSIEIPVTGLSGENTETRHLADDIFISQPHNQRLEVLSPFSKTQSSIKVNLTDITKQDIRQGGTYLGEHKGTVKDRAFDGLVVTELDKSSINYNSIRPLAKDVNDVTENGINYHFINLPYATYGALFTNEHDVKLFYKGLDINDYPAIYETTDNSKLNYIDSLKGDVTYKGNLIAVVTRGIPNTNQKLQEAPKTDGTITLNAYFGEKAEDNSLRGEIDSQTIGKVAILPNRIHTSNIIYSNEGHLQQLNENNKNRIYGSYVMQLAGKEAENITGEVNISYNNEETRVPGLYYKEGVNGKNIVTDYNAVFGAEKQPKLDNK